MNGISCAFTGRLSRDPESKYTRTGKAMLTLNVAVDENMHLTEQHPDAETTWCRVVCWEALADTLAAQLRKGSTIYVEGRLKLERWTAQDGTPRSGLACSAWAITPIGQIGRQRAQQTARPDERRPVTAGGIGSDDLGGSPF